MTRSVTVVIPCRNEEHYIVSCIQSVLKSQLENILLDVIIADGISTDATLQLIQDNFSSQSNVQVLKNKSHYTPQALNLGIKQSKATYVMILGAHSVIAPDYIQKCIDAFEIDPQIACTGGLLLNVSEDELASNISVCMSSPFGVGNANFRTGAAAGFVDTVAFGIYKRSVFDIIGLFDEELIRNQDDELNFRLLKNNFKIYLRIDTSINYFVRSSFDKLYQQYLQYGYWKVYVNKKHQTVTSIRQLIPFFWVIYLCLLAAVMVLESFVHLVLPALIPLALYLLIATLVASKKAAGLKDLFQRVYIFLILHTSYGYGYLKGMITFIVLNKKPEKRAAALTR
jgi:GT2 family glycosyltransferase